MWLFCKQGFFSVVEDQGTEDSVLIRARFPGDLERLLEEYVERTQEIPPGELIQHTPKGDYHWRMVWPKSAWAEMMRLLAEDVDYEDFKSRVREAKGSPRNQAYSECWLILRKAQAEAEKRQG